MGLGFEETRFNLVHERTAEDNQIVQSMFILPESHPAAQSQDLDTRLT